MAEKDLVEVEAIPSKDFRRIGNALMREGDPKVIRRTIAKELRIALKPAAVKAKAGIMSMHSGSSHGGVPLRASIARKIRPQIQLTARKTGVRLLVGKTPQVRGFAMAGRYTNRKSWRHRVFGSDNWVEQRGDPGWFDDPMKRDEGKYRKAILDALETVAKRITGA